MEAFRGSRVGWSVVLRTVAAAVPESTTITGLSGEAEVEAASKSASGKAKKQLIVNFATPMSEDGSVPREIDGFLAALRGDAGDQAALSAHRGLRPQGQSVQAWRASVRLLQHRLFAQGRNDQDSQPAVSRPTTPRAISRMNQKTAKTDYKEVILQQLRQPLKLRLLLCVAIIAGVVCPVLQPPERTDGRHHVQHQPGANRVATARQIDQLKKSMVPYQGRVPAGADVNELMRHVIAQMRTSPLKLLDLKPEKSKDLGPYRDAGPQADSGRTLRRDRRIPASGSRPISGSCGSTRSSSTRTPRTRPASRPRSSC